MPVTDVDKDIDALTMTITAEFDADAERLWAEEITRRLREIDEGRVVPIPWSEVRASILKR